MVHVIEPVKALTLDLDGKKVQVSQGRLDYFGDVVTVTPLNLAEPTLVLDVPPSDAGRTSFRKRDMIRVMATGEDGEVSAGLLQWQQVCSCNAATLKKQLLAIDPIPLPA